MNRPRKPHRAAVKTQRILLALLKALGTLLCVCLSVLFILYIGTLMRRGSASPETEPSEGQSVPGISSDRESTPPTGEGTGKNAEGSASASDAPTDAQATEGPTDEPTGTAPPATEPEVTEPTTTKPQTTKPSTTKPGTTKPPVTNPSTSEPPTTEPSTTEPPQTQTAPPTTEPPETDPPQTDPPVTDPPVTQPQGDPDRINDPDYFKDALFIGDSRTVGFYLYAKIPGASYFARTSMNVSNCFADKKSETGTGNLNLEEYLKANKFGKIYILLGINEIGYSYSWIISRYQTLLQKIQVLQPDAILLIQSNMHVTKAKSDANPTTFNNDRINELNRRLAGLADGEKIFFLDFAAAFDGEDGCLKTEYSRDGIHFYAKTYPLWRDWILENGKR